MRALRSHVRCHHRSLRGNNLYVWNRLLHITASIDGKTVSEIGKKQQGVLTFDIGPTWQEIPLSSNDCGKTLTLKIDNYSSRQYFKLSSACMGTYNDINLTIVRNNISNLAEGLIIILIAVILLIYSIVLRHYHINDDRMAMQYLSILSFTLTVWFMMDSPIMMIPLSISAFRYMAAIFSMFISAVPCVLFFSEILTATQKTLKTLLSFYIMALIAVLLMIGLGCITLEQSFYIFIIAAIIVFVMINKCCLDEYREKHDRLFLYLLMANAVLLTGAVANTLSYIFDNVYDVTNIFRRSYIVFLACIGFTLVRRSLRRFADIRAAAHYRDLAYVDPVTGGDTRLRFEEDINSRSRRDHAWFINIDLINYKIVNQAYGWEKGDRLLAEMYSDIKGTLRENERLCNLGNASFGYLLYSESGEDTKKRIADISARLVKCARHIDRNLLVGAAYYACPISEDENSLNELLDMTRMAYQNPYAERIPELNCYIYNDKCRKELLFDKELENALSDAIQNKEFIPYFQPKIDLSTGRMSCAEALSRWNSPKYGMLMPGRFIPLFERNGMIFDVDLCIFEQVCRTINHWVDVGLEPPRVSVNVSKAVIQREDLVKRYCDVVRKTHANPRYLEFELTESLAYDDYDKIQSILDVIHSYGSTCSMDDFGKSYSNLNALGMLNFDTVKMDKCFFDNGFPADMKKQQMVEGTLNLLKGLRLEVVAEGIEDADQAAELKRLGCDMIQGFYYAKPMPVSEFEMFMRASSNMNTTV
jgi:EAL domain-containing protein (putative c-di-GMP-specific phosphodiesterase class I)/GGDEF domain-containing protein